MREALSAGARRPMRRPRRAPRRPASILPASIAGGWSFVDGVFVPELVRSDARAGADHRLDGRGAGEGRCAGRAARRQDVRDRRRGGGAQHRADGRRRGHPRCRRRRDQAADPSGLCRRQRQAELGLHPLAGRGREGRQRHADRGARQRPTRRSMPRSSWWSATRRRSITSRSRRPARCTSRACWPRSARKRQLQQPSPSPRLRRVVRNQSFIRFAGEGTQGRHPRRHLCCAARSMSTPRC